MGAVISSGGVKAIQYLPFGDGNEGDVVESTRTLVRDHFYRNLTVPVGITLTLGGFRIFVRETLTLAKMRRPRVRLLR